MDQEPKSLKVELIDAPHAPTMYATAYSGIWLYAGAVHVTLEASRINHSTSPGSIQRVVIGKLVMPVEAAQRLAVGLFKFLTEHGVPPPNLPGPPTLPNKGRMQ